jgi:hypothetical protein
LMKLLKFWLQLIIRQQQRIIAHFSILQHTFSGPLGLPPPTRGRYRPLWEPLTYIIIWCWRSLFHNVAYIHVRTYVLSFNEEKTRPKAARVFYERRRRRHDFRKGPCPRCLIWTVQWSRSTRSAHHFPGLLSLYLSIHISM